MLSRKQKQKVYHGVPKSAIDNNTIFYCDFSGRLQSPINPIIENTLNPSSYKHVASPIGHALLNDSSVNYVSYSITPKTLEEITIDFFVQGLGVNKSGQLLRMYVSETTYLRVALLDDYTLHCDFVVDNTNKYNWLNFKSIIDFTNGCHHVRITVTPNDLTFFIDGKKYAPTNNLKDYDYKDFVSKVLNKPSFVRCFNRVAMCDLKISDINRGSVISNLPQDVIDGKAIIKPRFGQQQIKGDPIASQPVHAIIPSYETNNINKFYIDPVLSTPTVVDYPEINNILINSYDNSISSFEIRTFDTNHVISEVMVKNKSGTIVLGSGTGYGTNTVTFTPSESIIQEELYVTYYLTTPVGNSDYSELPHEILNVYDEVGNKLTKADTFKISDDFSGKVVGNTDICPHFIKCDNSMGTPITQPTGYTTEVSQGSYNSLNIADSTPCSIASPVGKMAQLLVAFDVVKMVENKLGTVIPATNKRDWIMNRVSKVQLKLTSKAKVLNQSYRTPLNVYVYSSSSWKSVLTFSSNSWDNDEYSVNVLNVVPTASGSINSLSQLLTNNYIYLLMYVKDNDNQCRLDIDYIKLDITLEKESNYDMFVLDTPYTKARNGIITNPVLVQKETKTVKRLLPSRECFVSEYSYFAPRTTSDTFDGNKTEILYSYPFMFLSTQGTGTYNDNQDYFRECLARLGLTRYKSYQFTNDIITNYQPTLGIVSPTRFSKVNCDSFYGSNYDNVPITNGLRGNFVALKPVLLKSNGNIILNILARYYIDGVNNNITEQRSFILPERPLIK